jgi:uncharacterized protein YecT (DUF1311 family)
VIGPIALALGAGLLAVGPAAAQDRIDPGDRSAIQSCLERIAQIKSTRAEDCIGIVQGPCTERSDGSSVSMNQCTSREAAIWNERFNAVYRRLQAGDIGQIKTQRLWGGGPVKDVTGADVLRDTQRAWIAFRDRKCDAAGLPMEGGSGATLLATECYLQETARQALWLESFEDSR